MIMHWEGPWLFRARPSRKVYPKQFIFTFLYAITKFISPDFRVLPERYIEGLQAKGNADYSIELQGGGVLGVTEVKKEDYVQGVA